MPKSIKKNSNQTKHDLSTSASQYFWKIKKNQGDKDEGEIEMRVDTMTGWLQDNNRCSRD